MCASLEHTHERCRFPPTCSGVAFLGWPRKTGLILVCFWKSSQLSTSCAFWDNGFEIPVVLSRPTRRAQVGALMVRVEADRGLGAGASDAIGSEGSPNADSGDDDPVDRPLHPGPPLPPPARPPSPMAPGSPAPAGIDPSASPDALLDDLPDTKR